MFYDTYVKLCNEHGEKPYNLPLKLGAKSNSMVAQWQKGSLPRPSMLEKIAEYFGVTVGYLMDGENKKSPPAEAEDEITMKLKEFALSATPEELQELSNYIAYIKSKRN